MKVSKRLARLGIPMTAYWYGTQTAQCIKDLRVFRDQMLAIKASKPVYTLTDAEEELASEAFRNHSNSVAKIYELLGNRVATEYYNRWQHQKDVNRIGRAITRRSVKMERYRRFTHNLND